MSAHGAFDPRIGLASSVQAQPGVFALLLGSGVSRAADIPTGWEIVTDLVRRAATALSPADADAPERAAADPEAWWAEHGDGAPLGYSNLLATLGPTAATRRDLIRRYFEHSDDDGDTSAKSPTAAHKAIAELAQRGYIRVIVTTNFDRLTERALEDAGVSPQVISRPESVRGMEPLAHAAVTVIKLHGDYADLDMRNTVDELATYPPEWVDLLDRINDEYGLLIAGWSAEWDTALAAALRQRVNRRYPIFWDSRSSKGHTASEIVASHHVTVVPAGSADGLFTGLLDSATALEHLREGPLTIAVQVARLKRYLPDPRRRIDLEELVLGAAEHVAKATSSRLTFEHPDGPAWRPYDRHLADLRALSEPMLDLLATGVYHDHDEQHIELWVDVVQRLLDARSRFTGQYDQDAEKARHYPAALALRCMGIAATARGHDATLLKMLTVPTHHNVGTAPAIYWLHDYNWPNHDGIKALPRWNGQPWRHPISRLLRDDLRDVLTPVFGSNERYEDACDNYEYRLALIQSLRPEEVLSCGVATGVFCGETAWARQGDELVPLGEVPFLRYSSTQHDDWVLWPLLGGRDGLTDAIGALRKHLWDLWASRQL